MEVPSNRPPTAAGDVQANRKTEAGERFAASGETTNREAEEARSDANTRLSREVDEANFSEEARRLAREDAER